MKIRIVKEPEWLWEKGRQFFRPPSRMQRAFNALMGLRLEEVEILIVPDQASMYGATVSHLQRSLANQHQRASVFEWGAHWRGIGLTDSTIIGIPASCCRVLEEK